MAGNGRVCRGSSLEDLALVEFSALLVLAYPLEVLVDQSLGGVSLGVQLFPVVGLVINGPVLTQLEREREIVSAS